MKISFEDIAILIFALSEKEETKRKAFLHNSGVHDQLLAQTKKTVAATGIDYYHFDEQQQVGDTFGERFANAITEVFEKGYKGVITMGSDAPSLSKQHIFKAADQLVAGNFAMGPSFDGGFYLMGIRKDHFNKEHFLNFSWNTSSVATEVRQYIQAQDVSIYRLPYLHDIDRFSDLKKVYTTIGRCLTQLRGLIQNLLVKPIHLYVYDIALRVQYHFKTTINRGPPRHFVTV